MYSAFSALDLAVTVDFSIEKAISANAAPTPPDVPRASAVAVGKPEPNVDTTSAVSAIEPSVSASTTPARPVGSA